MNEFPDMGEPSFVGELESYLVRSLLCCGISWSESGKVDIYAVSFLSVRQCCMIRRSFIKIGQPLCIIQISWRSHRTCWGQGYLTEIIEPCQARGRVQANVGRKEQSLLADMIDIRVDHKFQVYSLESSVRAEHRSTIAHLVLAVCSSTTLGLQ